MYQNQNVSIKIRHFNFDLVTKIKSFSFQLENSTCINVQVKSPCLLDESLIVNPPIEKIVQSKKCNLE